MTNEAGLEFTKMNHDEAIKTAERLYQAMCDLRDSSPVYLWDDECQEMEQLVASMTVSYQKRIEDMGAAQPSDYEQHNTMSKTIQGCK